MAFSQKMLNALEFDKVLKILCGYCRISSTEKNIKNIKPSGDFYEAEALLKKLSFFVECMSGDSAPELVPCDEVLPAVKRAQKGGILDFSMLLNINRVLKNSSEMYRYFQKHESNFSNNITAGLYVNGALSADISEKIISDDEMADTASDELFKIRRSISAGHGRIRSSLDSFVAKRAKILQEQIVTVRGGRYVVPVRAEYRSDVPGIVHDLSASGSTVFIEPSFVVSENNALRELYSREKSEMEKIAKELSEAVAENGRYIVNSFKTLVEIDAFMAKADFSLENELYMPKLSLDKEIRLYNARHPLIDKGKAVPIDVSFGGDVSGMIITGPNTGGKTVALKTIGLCAAMAGCGLFIPAESRSSIYVFSDILLAIGDEQSIEQSLSTFSAHMKTIVEITNCVKPESLVLLDEIGSGTDPAEGAALSIAVLEHIYRSGAMFAATTHYGELKLYALDRSYIQNASCEFDEKSLLPTYRLLMGLPGKSNALHIARRLGLSHEITDSAVGYMDKKNIDFEAVLSKTQQLYSENLEKSREIDKILLQIKTEKEQLRQQSLKLSGSKDKIISEAREKAKDIISSARAEARDIISQLSDMKSKGDFSLSKVNVQRRRLNQAEESLIFTDDDGSLIPLDSETVSPEKVKKGMEVWLNDIGQSAVVLREPDSSGRLTVQTENIRMDTYITNISQGRANDSSSSRDSRDVAKRDYKSTVSVKPRIPSETLHIRGERFEEAMHKTEQFLDDAVYNNLKTVTIVHGKGSGILKNGVHEMLRKNKFVKSFRLGMYGEGDHGVTVVEFE